MTFDLCHQICPSDSNVRLLADVGLLDSAVFRNLLLYGLGHNVLNIGQELLPHGLALHVLDFVWQLAHALLKIKGAVVLLA